MYELQVEGMRCGGCVARVNRAVQLVDDKATVNVDLKTQTVYISTGADIRAVMLAMDRAGYPVKTEND